MFKKYFKSEKEENLDSDKLYLNDLNQLEEIISQSNQKPLLIFKHSTRCGISRMVLKNFETSLKNKVNSSFYMLDILKNRNISNLIADKYNIQHESPQLIIFKNGKVFAHDSHHGILSLQW